MLLYATCFKQILCFNYFKNTKTKEEKEKPDEKIKQTRKNF